MGKNIQVNRSSLIVTIPPEGLNEELTNLKPEELKITQKKKDDIDNYLLQLGLTSKFEEIVPYSGYIAVIGSRSYGDDTKLVAKMTQLYVHGASKEGILCVTKHALGYGRPLQDTDTAEAFTNATEEELMDIDLFSYK